mmetsp:Transcript_27827/g.86661  ORF Transcript_27827/g.86661 Transcript_27827/m.86661 type:complete len:243 (-) Transcript_27827:1178-1906(-)
MLHLDALRGGGDAVALQVSDGLRLRQELRELRAAQLTVAHGREHRAGRVGHGERGGRALGAASGTSARPGGCSNCGVHGHAAVRDGCADLALLPLRQRTQPLELPAQALVLQRCGCCSRGLSGAAGLGVGLSLGLRMQVGGPLLLRGLARVRGLEVGLRLAAAGLAPWAMAGRRKAALQPVPAAGRLKALAPRCACGRVCLSLGLWPLMLGLVLKLQPGLPPLLQVFLEGASEEGLQLTVPC